MVGYEIRISQYVSRDICISCTAVTYNGHNRENKNSEVK